jgi:hypothetical protein
MNHKQLADWKRKKESVETRIETLQHELIKTHSVVRERGEESIYKSLIRKSRDKLILLQDHHCQELREAQHELKDIDQKIIQLQQHTDNYAKHGTILKVALVLSMILIIGAMPIYFNQHYVMSEEGFLENLIGDITGGINSITGATIGVPQSVEEPLRGQACAFESCCCSGGGGWDDGTFCWSQEGCGGFQCGTSCGGSSSSSSSGGPTGARNDSCGTVDASIYMNKSLTNATTCFTANTENITVNCQGHTITYGTGGGSGYAVDNAGGKNNVSVKNCIIVDGSESGSDRYAVYYQGAIDGTISNNTIYTKSQSIAIRFETNSDNNRISNNTINTSGSGAHGLSLFNADGNNISHNNITVWGDTSDGIRLSGSSSGNILLNNTFTKGTGNVIQDTTGDSNTNYLVYNNSNGEIRWINTANGRALKNLTFNITNNQGFGIGMNIDIRNGVVTLNSSALSNSNINDAVNITMRGLTAGTITHVLKHPDFTQSGGEVRANGTSCITEGTCEILSYGMGKLIFNTTSFSGFAPNEAPSISSLSVNTTYIETNDSNENVTAYWSDTDSDGDVVNNITTWYRNGTSIMALNMPFERINGSNIANTWDYSSLENSGTESGGVSWNGTTGYDSRGVYIFDGSDDTINISYDTSHGQLIQNFSVSAWIKPSSLGGVQRIVAHARKSNNDGFGFGTNGTNLQFKTFGVNNYETSSTSLQNNVWQHVVAVLNSSNQVAFYVDGLLDSVVTHTSPGEVNSDDELLIGGTTGPSSHSLTELFVGSIDEVLIWNKTLSPEQTYNLFVNRTTEFAANETGPGENWSIQVTPNDGVEDGVAIKSNNVTITTVVEVGNTAPTVPILVSPSNGSTTTNRTPTLVWNISTDADGDPITYNLLIDDNSAFNNLEVNETGITNNTATNITFNLSTTLDVDTTYFWKVRANDSTEYGTFSGIGNFTVQSLLSISVIDATVNFGSMGPGDTANTTLQNPKPFRAENVGNINFNGTITATKMFNNSAFPSIDYQFKVRENESGSFNTTLSNTSFINMNESSNLAHIFDVNWQPFKNDFLTDILITVPGDEEPGEKSSTVTFTVESQ